MGRLKPLRAVSLKEQVVERVREAIYSGEYSPGGQIRELHLARELRVSQPTVREALLELEHEALVVRTPNLGTTVTNMSRTEVADRLEVRLLLETEALSRACSRIDEEGIGTLEKHLDALSRSAAGKKQYESAQADLEFHRALWQCSGSPMLARALDQVTAPLFAFLALLRTTGVAPSDAERQVRSHAVILDTLRRRDLDATKAAIRCHIETPYELFLGSGMQDCRTFTENWWKLAQRDANQPDA